MKRLVAVLCAMTLSAPVAMAAVRTWTSSDGRFHVEADLMDFKDSIVHLKRPDGTVLEVPLVKFSSEDREFVKQAFPGAQEERVRPGAQIREWKSKDGKFSVFAEYLGVAEGKVRLRKLDASEISVDRGLLSKDDQDWVSEEVRRLREEEQEAARQAKSAEKEKDKDVSGELTAQDIPLKLVKLDPPRARSKSSVPSEYVLRLTTPQEFYMSLGKEADPRESEFRRVVRKEPTYSIPKPFRGVAFLGSKSLGFALDAVGNPPVGYNKLYFDVNGNGDLTDDKPITTSDVMPVGPGTVQSQFPRVDLSLDGDKKPLEYSVMVSALGRRSRSEAYLTVSLFAAAVREGAITQGKKQIRVLLVDRNSNARFNDTSSLRGSSSALGDLLLINPNPRNYLAGDATMGRDRYFVNKTLCIDNHFYRMDITPSGDSLKLTPSKVSVGYVSNSSPAYRAVLQSDDYGIVMVGGMKDQKISLPEGTWHLGSYTIDATSFVGGSRTAVAASFTEQATSVSVSNGSTSKLQFGAPYRPVVTSSRAEGSKVYLSLGIVGAGGERCTSFYINGNRPPPPKFIVKDQSGNVVHQGVFEWG